MNSILVTLLSTGISLLLFLRTCSAIGQVIWAVNAGGDSYTDVFGIKYQKDPLTKGTPSDFGKRLIIQRIPKEDQLLYQTERYHDSSFGYDITVTEDGEYVLVLKFCEVYFTSANEKVFDIAINDHTVISDLDIFARAGYGTALDEYVPFTVKNGILNVGGEAIPFKKVLSVRFLKGKHDNPKINALYVMKGQLVDVPKLPSLPVPAKDDEEDSAAAEQAAESSDSDKPRRHVSGPKVVDPYGADDSNSIVLPVAAAVGAFLPLLYCLCKI